MIATIRDVAIILLALENIVLLIVLLFIAWKGYQLARIFQQKAEQFSAVGLTLMETAKHTAESASGTASTVKGSVEFVTDAVVSPVVQVASAVFGARGFVSALFRPTKSTKNGGHK